MKIIVCLDDKNGISFNNRRQSQDREVYRDMISLVGIDNLWMSSYSYKNLPSPPENCHVDDNYWEAAMENDFCFVEDKSILSNFQCASDIIIYRWNRVYPADVKLPVDALTGWDLVERVNFPGFSHDLITREVYHR